MTPSTFSIVAFDPPTASFGIAVQSKFLAVGAVVPWALAGIGAIATQARANTTYGPEGLALLESGMSAEDVVKRLTDADRDRDQRQLGVVDRLGHSAAYTGRACLDWAGQRCGENFTCQGNILAGPAVVEGMARGYTDAAGPFPERLVAALAAGQEAGGDRRGKESAALLVVREKGGYAGLSDRAVDLRVDDHPDPISELARILALHRLYFSPVRKEDAVPLDGVLKQEMAEGLRALGYESGSFEEALARFVATENFESRGQGAGFIDRPVLNYFREKVRSLRR